MQWFKGHGYLYIKYTQEFAVSMHIKHISKSKMGSSLLFLHFPSITFIIFLAVPLSNGYDVNYRACSNNFSCGEIHVGYPFWGDKRPKFCGIPNLELTCNQSDMYPTLNVFTEGDVSLRVLSIDTSSHTLSVSSKNLFSRCYSRRTSGVRLLSSLNLGANYNHSIRLFYDCKDGCHPGFPSKYSNCSYFEGSNSSAAYYFGNSKPSCSCKNNVLFQVDKRVPYELNNTKASLIDTLTKWPYEVGYNANFTDCSKCEKSGGKCGSSVLNSDQFACYCREGPPSLVCKNNGNRQLGLILGLGTGGALLLLVAFIGIWYSKKLATRNASLDCSASELEMGSIYFGVPFFSYSELEAATANFDRSRELGNGGFGIVYFGKLKDGREVAVKRLYEKSYKRLEQFMNEVQILTRLRHQNLVSLYGCTSQHCRELLLVYEYVKNGTVADHLYGKHTVSGLLPWPVRLRIAVETATALSYLHASDIIHRDVKTNNILLDCNFTVKVADFGLSRLFPTDVTHVSTAPQGTPGYLDPEYHQYYQLTDKSDVYSFGVVLIELISSLPAIDMDRPKNEINLFNYAMNRIQRCAFDELVDPQLGFALDFKVRRMTTLVAELAFQCLQHDKEFRPSMDEVSEVLKSIEGSDYEALQAEEMAKNVGVEDDEALQAADLAGVKMHASDRLPSPADDDHAQLLNNHPVYTYSPISVMNRWVSRSTTSTTSN